MRLYAVVMIRPSPFGPMHCRFIDLFLRVSEHSTVYLLQVYLINGNFEIIKTL